MSKHLIDFIGISKSYDSNLVLDDLNLYIRENEFLTLLGPSGCGKTTTLRLLGGFESPDKGQILFDGLDLLTCERSKLRKIQGNEISMIFQEPMTSLNPVKRIGWQIEESLRIHTELNKEERYQKAIEMMKEVELPDPERQYPHELSGGMRQRVMIAAAMICNPRILIADEPTTALDVTIQAQIVELLKRMNREKQTSILFISHDLSLVKQLCERVLVMKGGYIVETGLTQEVFAHPKEEYTQRLIAAIPKVKRNGK